MVGFFYQLFIPLSTKISIIVHILKNIIEKLIHYDSIFIFRTALRKHTPLTIVPRTVVICHIDEFYFIPTILCCVTLKVWFVFFSYLVERRLGGKFVVYSCKSTCYIS